VNIMLKLCCQDMKRRYKDGFFIGYNLLFPVLLIALLGYLTNEGYGSIFTGYQYYSVVLLPFCVLLSIITAAYAAKEEAYRKTAVRFLFSPVSRAQLVLSRLLSCSLLLSGCNLLVLVVARLLFGLPVMEHFIPIAALMTAISLAVCSCGLFIGYGMRNFILVKNLINLPVIAAGTLGGSFFPLGSLNPVMEFAIKLSPLTWVNRSIFLCIYDGKESLLWKTTIISILVGLVFTALTVILFKREEFIHGDLPGYEK
jgi:ABC-2 type transport system permease protein